LVGDLGKKVPGSKEVKRGKPRDEKTQKGKTTNNREKKTNAWSDPPTVSRAQQGGGRQKGGESKRGKKEKDRVLQEKIMCFNVARGQIHFWKKRKNCGKGGGRGKGVKPTPFLCIRQPTVPPPYPNPERGGGGKPREGEKRSARTPCKRTKIYIILQVPLPRREKDGRKIGGFEFEVKVSSGGPKRHA